MQGVHFRRVRGKRQQVRTGKRCLAYDWMYVLCIDLQVQLAGGMRDGLRCLRRDVAFGGSDLFLQEGHLQAGRNSLRVASRVRIALAKNAGCLQNGSHMLLFLLASFAKQA